MADVILAEYDGRTWLVSGERYIDDLLANTLPSNVSIEFVACKSKVDVDSLWVQNCGAQSDAGSPWMIHPAIAARIRRTEPGHSVFFAQWSVLLDDDAHAVIRASASRALQHAEVDVVLTRYVGAGGPQAMADLANLRASLVEAELAKLGVPSRRILRDTRDV